MPELPLVAAAAFVPIAFATGLVAHAKPAGPGVAPSANQIADRVQKFYDETRTYQASFQQRYLLFAYRKEKRSSGKVTFHKPGKMSWRYTSNASNGNRIVSDGKTVKAYEAANKQMFVRARDSTCGSFTARAQSAGENPNEDD